MGEASGHRQAPPAHDHPHAGGPLPARGAPPSAPTHDLALMLEPTLREACEGRLGAIEWFHAAWQRGGAATGFSTYAEDAHAGAAEKTPVLVKLPLGPVEYRWTTGLGAGAGKGATALVSPRVLAHADALGGYDLAWCVMERLAGDHLPHRMDETLVCELLSRVLAFQQEAGRLAPVEGTPRTPDWHALIEQGRRTAHDGGLEQAQQWNDALRKVQRALPHLSGRWQARPIDTWCHGDVHPGNVLRRDCPGSPCVLIDLALVHPGSWIEDALYLERQYWGHEDWIAHAKPVSILARLRREAGLQTGTDYPVLANIRRVLMAACAPAMMQREGNPKYLRAALGHIDRLLPQVVHA